MEDERKKYEKRFTILKKMKIAGCCIAIILSFVAGMLVNQWFQELKEYRKVTTDYISGKLEDVGELTTQKLTYTGQVSLTKGKIPFITKNGFSMKYTAVMRAGMEFSEFDMKVKDKKVVVEIPHASVLGVKVESDTIEFYDETFSIFNRYGKEGTAEAIALAEEDVLEKADYSELLKNADEYAEELIHEILDDSVGRREVVVSFKATD